MFLALYSMTKFNNRISEALNGGRSHPHTGSTLFNWIASWPDGIKVAFLIFGCTLLGTLCAIYIPRIIQLWKDVRNAKRKGIIK